MKLSTAFYHAWLCHGIDGGVKLLRDTGYDAIDMSYYQKACPAFLGEDYREKAYELKEALQKYGMTCNQAHAPTDRFFTLPQDDSCPEYVRLKRSIESAAILGIPHIVVEGAEVGKPHASYKNLEHNCAFYRRLEPLCEKHGIAVAIENLKGSFTYPDLINEALHRLDSPWFKTVVDVGHSWVRAELQPGDFIRQLDRGSVCGLHIQDTHGIRRGLDEHLLPWMAEIDFEDLMLALKETGYEGDLTLEVGGFLKPYAERGLLEPALRFSAAVGRKLISLFESE